MVPVEAFLARMRTGLVEREEASALVLLAALSGEHVLLLGPPGTAKSQLARRLHAVVGGGYFERLLTRFTVPEELFGPLSIKRLEEDEYHRLTEGYLPTATVAFLDEVFKANSAILNALLTLLNEREFDNGIVRDRCPLMAVVAASNEVPEGSELAALYDRFLFRIPVAPVSDAGFEELLSSSAEVPEIPATDRLSPEQLGALQAKARDVVVPPSVRTAVGALRRSLRDRGLYISDRRWRQLVRTLRVAALCEGRESVSLADVWLCEHVIWDVPAQRETAAQLVEEALGDQLVEEPKRFASVTEAFRTQLRKEVDQQGPLDDEYGQPLFLDDAGKPTTDGNGPALRFAAPKEWRGPEQRDYSSRELWEGHFRLLPSGMSRLEAWTENPLNHRVYSQRERCIGPRRFSEDHLARRKAQVGVLREEVERFRAGLESIQASSSLWVAKARLRLHAKQAAEGLEAIDALTPLLDDLEELLKELAERSP
ncbi:MAG: AAA family ATPase [Myxococcota bacterium]